MRQSTRRRTTRRSILAGTAATIIAATATMNPTVAFATGDDVTAPVIPVAAPDRGDDETAYSHRQKVGEPDAEAPTASITVLDTPVNVWYRTAVDLRLGADDDTGVDFIDYRTAGAENSAFASQANVIHTVSADGVTDVTAIAQDLAGNRSEPAKVTLSIDGTAPTVTVDPLTSDGSTAEVSLGKDVTLGYLCADATSGVDNCTVEGATKSVEGEVTLRTDVLGEHRITITARDMAGNTHEEVVAYRVVPLDGRPVVAYGVADPSASGWYRGDVTVSITATDDNSVDRIDWATYGAQSGEGELGPDGGDVVVHTDGETEVWMYATDDEENYSPIKKVFIKRDATPPTILVNGQRDAAFTFVQGATATFTMGCEDATSGVATCDVLEGAASASGPISVDTTRLGEHSVTVASTDVAGNEVTREVTYAVVAPTAPGGGASVPAAAAPSLAATGAELHPALPLTAAGLLFAAGLLSLFARSRYS